MTHQEQLNQGEWEKKIDEYVDSTVEDAHFNRPWLKAHMKEYFKDLIQHIAKEEYERGKKDAVEFLKENGELVMTDHLWYIYKSDFEAALNHD